MPPLPGWNGSFECASGHGRFREQIEFVFLLGNVSRPYIQIIDISSLKTGFYCISTTFVQFKVFLLPGVHSHYDLYHESMRNLCTHSGSLTSH